ncbi:MAG: helical backbone metal receptor [Wenzhouxiangella sp.]
MAKPCPGSKIRTTILATACLVLGIGSLNGAATERPERIVSLAPHLTELAFDAGLGEQLVGVVAYSDYPPAAQSLPVIGDAFRFDLEQLLRLDTQLALAWDGGTPTSVIERLQSLGIEVALISTRTLDDIPAAIRTLADYSQQAERGEQAALALETALNARREQVPDDRGTLFYQVSERPLFTLGGRHVISEVAALCGLENLFIDLDSEAAAVDLEAVLSRQPDWIVIGNDQSGREPGGFWTRRGIDATRVLVVDPTLLIRPTARILDGIDELCALTAGAGNPP